MLRIGRAKTASAALLVAVALKMASVSAGGLHPQRLGDRGSGDLRLLAGGELPSMSAEDTKSRH